TAGAMGPSDLLVVVLIADAVQNAMSGSYESITEGAMLAFVIFGWATLIDWLDYKFPDLHIAEAAPKTLVLNGKFMRKNMARQLVTEEEVLAQLRQHGQESPQAVARAVMEGDGHISVILKNRGEVQPADPRKQA
ncbi:MAG TPA: YetF domain-containing protein, partial [Usitatibacter sp.]|nr:YetF domain-containing protein [Usitatibacter sp.]